MGARTDIAGERVLVLGMGRSGLASVRALRTLGCRVTATDSKPASDLGAASTQLAALKVPLAAGGHPLSLLEGVDRIILSPGVPHGLPILREAEARGIPRWGELELAWALSDCRWAAVTGTNGKTTTTALTGELFRQAGEPHLVGGNIGLALADRAPSLGPDATVVAEVSSFQLEDTETFRPHAAAILNLTPDHLDRYAGMEEYAAAKARIFARQEPGDFLVLNARDPRLERMAGGCRPTVLWFDSQGEADPGAYVRGGKLALKMPGQPVREVLAVRDLGIPGPHNLENALAALLLGAAFDLPLAALAAGLREFKGVPHRLEPCGLVRGVSFVNDSKGTNVDAVSKALQSFDRPIHLILGGRDKAGDFTVLTELIRDRVRTLTLLGEAAAKVRSQVGHLKPCGTASSLGEAVRRAYAAAGPGEVVLLSPGCASFDMFRDYEHRGEEFKAEVGRLRSEEEAK